MLECIDCEQKTNSTVLSSQLYNDIIVQKLWAFLRTETDKHSSVNILILD